MEIRIGWWNTSLAPTARSEGASVQELQVANSLARILTDEIGLDLLVLGEVTSETSDGLVGALSNSEFSTLDAAGKVGRTRFDLAMLFRSSKLRLLSDKQLVVQHGQRTLKLGHRAEFSVFGSPKPLHVVASHWPSRLWTEQDHSDRHLLGARLRQVADDLFQSESDAQIVLIGDYNDEPFDRSIAEQLLATRDRDFASRAKHLFYNPFWRHLSSTSSTTSQTEVHRVAGSYFHKNGQTTRWRTFDQIIVSHSLLGTGDWEIDDLETKVLNIPTYTDIVVGSDYQFDHLPVVTTFRRKTHD
jgi:hypothetical protein